MHELPRNESQYFRLQDNISQAENFTHVLGYVAEASVQDINNYSFIKENHVPGLRVGKTGLEKSLEKELIGSFWLTALRSKCLWKKNYPN